MDGVWAKADISPATVFGFLVILLRSVALMEPVVVRSAVHVRKLQLWSRKLPRWL